MACRYFYHRTKAFFVSIFIEISLEIKFLLEHRESGGNSVTSKLEANEKGSAGIENARRKSPDEFQGITLLYRGGGGGGGVGTIGGRFSHKSFSAESTAPSRISLQVNSRCPYYDSWSAYPRSTRCAWEFR